MPRDGQGLYGYWLTFAESHHHMQIESSQITFEATLLELSHTFSLKKVELIAKIIIGCSFLLIILHGNGTIGGGRPVTILCMLLLTIGLMIGWSSSGLQELDHNDTRGVILIDKDKIIWKGYPIPWNQIKKIDISYSEYEYKLKKRNSFPSDGTNNIVVLTLKDGSRLRGRIFIESRDRQLELKRVFWHVIMNNPISLANARKMIKPANQQERKWLEYYAV